MGEREVVPVLRQLEDDHAVHVGGVDDAPLRTGDGAVDILGAEVGELDEQLAHHPFKHQRFVERPALAITAAVLADVEDRLLVNESRVSLLTSDMSVTCGLYFLRTSGSVTSSTL